MTDGGKNNPGAHRDAATASAAPPRPNRLSSLKNDFAVHDFVNPFSLFGAHKDAATGQAGLLPISQTPCGDLDNLLRKPSNFLGRVFFSRLLRTIEKAYKCINLFVKTKIDFKSRRVGRKPQMSLSRVSQALGQRDRSLPPPDSTSFLPHSPNGAGFLGWEVVAWAT
jgi:hypothetical protein